jgi:hypothetical protein
MIHLSTNLLRTWRFLPVTIGRASQPFPRPKPDRPVSEHPAFQKGIFVTVLVLQHSSLAGRKPGQEPSSRLPAPVMQSLYIFSVCLPWRTFTISLPLQQGCRAYARWLLPSLRPPLRPLAFSRPALAGKAVREFPYSKARDVKATLSCLLYAGRIRDNTCRSHNRQAPRLPVLGQVYQPLTPVLLHDASNAGSSRQHRSQDWLVNRLWLAVAKLLSASFRPRGLPTPNACRLILAPLSKYNSFWSNLSPRERAHTAKAGGLRAFESR